jgi:hypothetical protein
LRNGCVREKAVENGRGRRHATEKRPQSCVGIVAVVAKHGSLHGSGRGVFLTLAAPSSPGAT